jgi:hypothetical protein
MSGPPSCTDVCEVVRTMLGGFGFKFDDTEDHTDMLEALAKVRFVLTQPKKGERVWPLWNLTEETIRAVAKKNGLSLTGRDFDEIARVTKKGIDAALDFAWEEAVENAINNEDANWKFEVMSHELIDGSTFTSGRVHSDYELWKGEIECKAEEDKFLFDFELTRHSTQDGSTNEIKITSQRPEPQFPEEDWSELVDRMITYIEGVYKGGHWKE